MDTKSRFKNILRFCDYVIIRNKILFLLCFSVFFSVQPFKFISSLSCLFHRLNEKMSHRMRKPIICICETKVQIIYCEDDSTFVFATWIVQFLYFLNFRPQAFSSACTARFVSNLFHTVHPDTTNTESSSKRGYKLINNQTAGIQKVRKHQDKAIKLFLYKMSLCKADAKRFILRRVQYHNKRLV